MHSSNDEFITVRRIKFIGKKQLMQHRDEVLMKTSVVYTQFWDVPVWWFDVNIIVGSWKQHSTGAANLVNKKDADCSVDEREETYSTA